jgi:ketosteroid isomerase-like protein
MVMFRKNFAVLGVWVAMSAAFAATPVAPPSAEQILADGRAKVAAAAIASRAAAKTAEEKAVVEADLAFAADAKKRGAMEAFAAVMHPEGKTFPPRNPIVVGVEATRAAFKDDTALWEWAPVQVVAKDGLGVTWGVAVISDKDKDGKLVAFTTRYVSVWRKDAGGAWKMWLDVGTAGPLPEIK